VFRALKEAIESLLRVIDRSSSAAAAALRRLDPILQRVRQQLLALSGLVAGLKRQVEQALGLLEHLLAICRFLEQQQDDIEVLMGEDAVAELYKLLRAVKGLHPGLDELNRSLDSLNNRLAPLADQVRRLMDQLTPLVQRAEQLAESLETASSNVSAAVQQALAAINRLLDALPQWLKDAIGRLGDALGQFFDWLDQQSGGRLRRALDEINRLLGDARAQINQLEARVAAELDPITSKLEELQRQVEQLEALANELQTAFNTAREKLTALLEQLRTLEGFLSILALAKLLREYLLGREAGKLKQPISELKDGDLVALVKSGRARELAGTIGRSVALLEAAVDLARPNVVAVSPTDVLGPAYWSPSKSVDAPGLAQVLRAQAIAGAYRAGQDTILAAVQPWVTPMRRVVLRLGLHTEALRRAVSAPVTTANVAQVKKLIGELDRVLAQVPEVTQPVDPATLPAGYFENATAFLGLGAPVEMPEESKGRAWGFTVINTTNQTADDLHVTLSGSGGSLRDPRVVHQPEGAPEGRASIGPDGNRVDVEWDQPCIMPGDTVVIVVESEFVPLEVVKVVWTLNNQEIQDG
jgi:predicted  nucleic acid-binding Zn-ribbon protein